MARKKILELERSDPAIWGHLEYPEHPFPAAICSKMSLFPPGIVALCLTQSISCPVINAMSLICENLDFQGPHAQKGDFARDNRLNAAICIRLLQTFQLSLVERLLLLTIASYCYFKVGDPVTWQNADGFIQVGCLRLMGQPVPDADAKTVLWEAMVLRAFGDETPAREYSDVLLKKVRNSDPQLLTQRYDVAKGFFWGSELTEILERLPFNL
jgi:hypothetical protein